MFINPYIYSLILIVFGFFFWKFAEEEIEEDFHYENSDIKKIESLLGRFKTMLGATVLVLIGFYLV